MSVKSLVMSVLLGPGVVFFFFYLVVRFSSPNYKAVFSDAHLLEVWTRIGQAKAAAIEGLAHASSTGNEDAMEAAIARGQRVTTSAGMTFIYTIDRESDLYAHHISMSHQPVLARAAATYFAALLGQILSIDIRDCTIYEGRRTVYHIVFELDEVNQQKFAEEPVAAPDLSTLPQIKERVRGIRRDLVGSRR